MTAIIPTALQTVSTQAHSQAPRREHPFYEGEYLDPEPVSEPAHVRTSKAIGRQPHPFYKDEFLDPEPASKPVQVRTPKATVLQPHPFYEGEFLSAKDSQQGEPEKPLAPPKLAAATEEADEKAIQKHPFYEDEYLAADQGSRFFGNDGLNFLDLLDVVNPLQHVPILSSLYRQATGDEISPFARMAGGFLFGGPAGFAASFANAVIEDATGKDIGETVIAMITGDDIDTATQVASISATYGQATSRGEGTKSNASSKLSHSVPTIETGASTDEVVAVDGPISLLPKGSEVQTSLAERTEAQESKRALYGGMTATDLSIDSHGHLSTSTLPSNKISSSLFETVPKHDGGQVSAKTPRLNSPNTFVGLISSPLLQDAQYADGHKSVKDASLGSEQTAAHHTSSEEVEPNSINRTSGKRGAPPTRNSETPTTSVRRKPVNHVIPNGFIPKSMMDALTKYEALLKQQRSASSGLTL